MAKKKCPASEKKNNKKTLGPQGWDTSCISSANKQAWNFPPFFWLSIKVVSSNGVTTNFPLCMRSWHCSSSNPRNVKTSEDGMDSDSDVGELIELQESCSNGIKWQISNSSDTSDADGCQRKTRRPKLRRRPTRKVRLPSCKHHYEEDTSDDDGLFDSIKTVSDCSKIVSAAKDGFASSNESESGLADLPRPYVPYIKGSDQRLAISFVSRYRKQAVVHFFGW